MAATRIHKSKNYRKNLRNCLVDISEVYTELHLENSWEALSFSSGIFHIFAAARRSNVEQE
jgi:hypothetical protein